MTRGRFPRPVRLAAVLAVVGAGSLQAQDTAVFRSTVDAVTVGVSVSRNNRPVTGLGLADFEVTDNGVPQRVSEITYEKQPIDMTVLLDVSQSVSGAVIDQLRRAVSELSEDLQAEDRLRVLTFNMRVQRILAIDDAPRITDDAFASVTAGGSSAVLDALAVALVSPTASNRRQFVVLFSDGTDSASISSTSVLLDVAQRTTPTVSVVLAVPYEQAPHGIYRDLAQETGGTLVSLRPNEDLGDSLRRALDQFRSSYVLTYLPDGVAGPGAHTIDVRVRREGVTVRARRGYVVQ